MCQQPECGPKCTDVPVLSNIVEENSILSFTFSIWRPHKFLVLPLCVFGNSKGQQQSSNKNLNSNNNNNSCGLAVSPFMVSIRTNPVAFSVMSWRNPKFISADLPWARDCKRQPVSTSRIVWSKLRRMLTLSFQEPKTWATNATKHLTKNPFTLSTSVSSFHKSINVSYSSYLPKFFLALWFCHFQIERFHLISCSNFSFSNQSKYRASLLSSRRTILCRQVQPRSTHS